MSIETCMWLCSETNILDFQSSEQQNGVSTVSAVNATQYRGVQIK